jgi:hypothetical protein
MEVSGASPVRCRAASRPDIRRVTTVAPAPRYQGRQASDSQIAKQTESGPQAGISVPARAVTARAPLPGPAKGVDKDSAGLLPWWPRRPWSRNPMK